MATGGTGDILTGMIAGMIAQNPIKVFESVTAAVYLHGLAGDIAREIMGEHCLVATDLVKTLPQAFRRVQRDAQEKFVRINGRSLLPSRRTLTS
jgi:NAD(P)H-hydrate epimerase